MFGNSYSNAMWGGMLDLAGGTNIARDRIRTGLDTDLTGAGDRRCAGGRLHHRLLWAASPNSVRVGYDVDAEAARRSLPAYAQRPGWDTLPAIRHGELHGIEADVRALAADWIAMQYLAKQLHPQRFGDVDPVTSLRAYHEAYLPMRFEGTWMVRAS